MRYVDRLFPVQICGIRVELPIDLADIVIVPVSYTHLDVYKRQLEYNKLGSPASLGCVRLTTADAKWIYDNCKAGTKTLIYDNTETPGPLGKPEDVYKRQRHDDGGKGLGNL